ncbi:MAG: hypothetical protein KDB66_03335 [Solirubrobacterales bacterium]|nr:hypothetical protein [Solirubrobacterales bacterium]
MSRLILVVLVGLVACLTSPNGSIAQPFRTGFVDNAAFYNVNPDVGSKWMAKAKSDGARMIRLNVYWDTIAPAHRPKDFNPVDPADPSYDFTLLDQALKSVRTHGLTPMLMAFLAPAWAEGPNRNPVARMGTWRPDPVQFAKFGKALALRYNGAFPDPASPGENLPAVRFFQAWNEPNLTLYLNPQAVGGRLTSPGIFRELQNRFYSAVKSVSPKAKVLAGGLAPIGRPNNVVIAPLKFLRRATCMTRKGKLQRGCHGFLRADIWDAHPFTSGGPTHEAPGPDDVSLGDLPELSKTLKAADRIKGIRGVDRNTELWATEFSWDTEPPDPGGVPMWLAKRWVAEALYRMWKSGVSTMSWLSIVDAPDATAAIPWKDGAQSGFYFNTKDPSRAKAKASLQAFRFPFVAFKRRHGIFVWGRTPQSAGGRVAIRVNRGRGWSILTNLRADETGIFRRFIRTNVTHGRVRAVFKGTGSVGFSLRRVPDRFFRPFGG